MRFLSCYHCLCSVVPSQNQRLAGIIFQCLLSVLLFLAGLSCFSSSSCLLPGLSSSMLCYLTIFSVDQRAVASGNAFACMCLCFLLMSVAPSFAQLLQVKSNL